MSGLLIRTCARRTGVPVSPATIRPRSAPVPVFGARPGGSMLIGTPSPLSMRIVCDTCCAAADDAKRAERIHATRYAEYVERKICMVRFWTRFDPKWLIRADFLRSLQSAEFQVERFRAACAERERGRGLRGAREPVGIAPFALLDVFDRNREVRAGRQIPDLELSLLIGPRGRHPTAVRQA